MSINGIIESAPFEKETTGYEAGSFLKPI